MNENQASSRANESFEQMMAIAEFAAKRHNERRQVFFRIFISYITFLAVAAGVIMKYWDDLDDLFKNECAAGILNLALGIMLVFYWKWLRSVYTALVFDVRRRDFFLTKAEAICFHKSEEFANRFVSSDIASLNLGGGVGYKLSKVRLFRKSAPDIARYVQDSIEPSKPKHYRDSHFLFSLMFPLIITLLMMGALTKKSGILALSGSGLAVAVCLLYFGIIKKIQRHTLKKAVQRRKERRKRVKSREWTHE